jgi:hypothetical protein
MVRRKAEGRKPGGVAEAYKGVTGEQYLRNKGYSGRALLRLEQYALDVVRHRQGVHKY